MPPNISEARNLDDLRDEYLQNQLAGDRRAALSFIDATLRSGVTVADVRSHIVQAAQREIGRLWQEDRISIAQEHMATAISQLVTAHLFQHAKFSERVGRKVLVACVPGELHEFPARLLADALDMAGFDVRFLGADVPADDLLEEIAREKPDLLALSVTMIFNLRTLGEVLKEVRASHATLRIAVGGLASEHSNAFPSDTRTHIITGDSVRFIERLETLIREAA